MLFEAVRAQQGAIHEVWEAFERVPDKALGDDAGRERAVCPAVPRAVPSLRV